MDDILLRSRLNMPLVTGTPGVGAPNPGSQQTKTEGPSFQELLEQRMRENRTISVSKHAAARIEQRNIELDEAGFERLQEGIGLAKEKGLDDTLIIIDQNAFIVSAKNETIITALGRSDLRGSVITNISGTVII